MITVDQGPALAAERGGPLTRRRPAIDSAVRGARGHLRRPAPSSALAVADIVAMAAAFAATSVLLQPGAGGSSPAGALDLPVFAVTLPLWVAIGRMHGLYRQDDQRVHHSTADELPGIFNFVTLGAWLLFAASWATGAPSPAASQMVASWAIALATVPAGRATARALCRRTAASARRTVIVGAGEVGQLIARKLARHPEYGVDLLGFVDAAPTQRWRRTASLPLLGAPEELPELVGTLGVERVVIAFSNDAHAENLRLIRRLHGLGVRVDVVPRLFEALGPGVTVNSVEGLPLFGLPLRRLSRGSRMAKRALDIAGASILILLTAPVMAYATWRIRRSSTGPVLFRQTRLGQDMREFTMLKFRTMQVEAPDDAHRAYIRASMRHDPRPEPSGLYKLERHDAVTPIGKVLRRTSLDELPQLFNVLRGDMSLVGPRPCLAYEAEHFRPEHFERFSVPAGLTGLWQVTARARSSFAEALDMDVAYVRDWSLWLDLRIVCQTPVQVLRHRRRGTA